GRAKGPAVRLHVRSHAGCAATGLRPAPSRRRERRQQKYMKFSEIQQTLKSPKDSRNEFGKYNYRTCSAILEAVKPLLGPATLIISDELVLIGERYYIKATATYSNKDEGETFTATAYAREPLDKRGMDEAQITGASSTYARKAALSGLFAIDDS